MVVGCRNLIIPKIRCYFNVNALFIKLFLLGNSSIYAGNTGGKVEYISIIGPILEEIFYRGRLLKEALKKYKSKYAVIIVSVLFAISHANLPQFISALCLGLLCGGVYVMAKDIKAPITIHVANNLYSSMMTLRVESYETYKVSEFRMVGSIIIGIPVWS